MVPGGDADHEDGDDGVQHRGGHRGVGGAVEEGQEPAHFKKYTSYSEKVLSELSEGHLGHSDHSGHSGHSVEIDKFNVAMN